MLSKRDFGFKSVLPNNLIFLYSILTRKESLFFKWTETKFSFTFIKRFMRKRKNSHGLNKQPIAINLMIKSAFANDRKLNKARKSVLNREIQVLHLFSSFFYLLFKGFLGFGSHKRKSKLTWDKIKYVFLSSRKKFKQRNSNYIIKFGAKRNILFEAFTLNCD